MYIYIDQPCSQQHASSKPSSRETPLFSFQRPASPGNLLSQFNLLVIQVINK